MTYLFMFSRGLLAISFDKFGNVCAHRTLIVSFSRTRFRLWVLDV